jgi:hypothetical protein
MLARLLGRTTPVLKDLRSLGTVIFCTVGLHGIAAAQDAAETGFVSVSSRQRPEYDALGVPLGALRLYPSVTLGRADNDNIFATTDDPVADQITTLAATLRLVSTAGRAPVALYASADSGSYSDHPLENYDDWATGASVSYEFAHSTSLDINGDYAVSHELRSDPSFPAQAIEQPRFDRKSVLFGVSHAFPSGKLGFKADLSSLNYHDAITPSGVLNQDGKDYDFDNYSLEGSIAAGRSTSMFVRAIREHQLYRLPESGALDRDATTDTVLAGVSLDVTHIIRGELALGVFHVDNADPTQKDTRSFTASSNIEFFVTQLMSATLVITRDSGAANIVGAATYVSTEGGIGLDYELRRNVVLSAHINSSHRDYSGIEQTERTKTERIAGRWLLNRRMSMDFSYASIDRVWPPGSGIQSYAAKVLTVGLTLAL